MKIPTLPISPETHQPFKRLRDPCFSRCAHRRNAFLRGSRRDNRMLGMDPSAEMRERLRMKDTEICELLKSADRVSERTISLVSRAQRKFAGVALQNQSSSPMFVFPVKWHWSVTWAHWGSCRLWTLLWRPNLLRNSCEAGKEIPFGSKRETDFIFTGIHISQDESHNIHLDQREYVLGISSISIDRNRRKLEQEAVLESERQGLRGLIGSLQYAASNTRPDVSARLSFLKSRIKCATIHDLLEASHLLGDAKSMLMSLLPFRAFLPNRFAWFHTLMAHLLQGKRNKAKKDGRILAAHENVCHQKSAKASPLVWFSQKIDRVVASTLAAETFALSSMWTCWIGSDPHGSGSNVHKTPWQKPEEVWSKASPGIAVVDCKSLFDVSPKKNPHPNVNSTEHSWKLCWSRAILNPVSCLTGCIPQHRLMMHWPR